MRAGGSQGVFVFSQRHPSSWLDNPVRRARLPEPEMRPQLAFVNFPDRISSRSAEFRWSVAGMQIRWIVWSDRHALWPIWRRLNVLVATHIDHRDIVRLPSGPYSQRPIERSDHWFSIFIGSHIPKKQPFSLYPTGVNQGSCLLKKEKWPDEAARPLSTSPSSWVDSPWLLMAGTVPPEAISFVLDERVFKVS